MVYFLCYVCLVKTYWWDSGVGPTSEGVVSFSLQWGGGKRANPEETNKHTHTKKASKHTQSHTYQGADAFWTTLLKDTCS